MQAKLHHMTSRVPPVVRAAAISCTVMGAGDVICQKLQQRHIAAPVEWQRTGRFSLVGLTMHGPFFYHGYRWLDTFTPGSPSLRGALLKTSIGQVTLFPTYLSSALMALQLLEGRTVDEAVARLQKTFVPAYFAGSFFWPAANLANFMFVPASGRVLFANAAGLVWNAYLSLVNSGGKELVPAVVRELRPASR